MSRKKPSPASMSLPHDRRTEVGTTGRILIAVAVVAFALTRYYILFGLTASSDDQYQLSDVGSIYFRYAVRAADLHQTPYAGAFPVEYPPVAWWAIYGPRLYDSQTITNPQDLNLIVPALYSYMYAFRGQMCLLDAAAFTLFVFLVLRRRPGLAGWAALSYVVLTAILGRVLYDRLDMGLLFFLMLWAYAWTRSLDETRGGRWWSAAAFLAIGMSVSYKVVPVLCLPFLLLCECYGPRRIARLGTAMATLAAGVCTPFVVQYFLSGPGVFDLFKYHAEREIHLESLYSTLLWMLAPLGWPIAISYNHGGFNLVGALAPSMKILAAVLMCGFLLGMGGWALARRSRFDRRAAYCFSCYVVAAAVTFAQVLSPQYFIWAFPLLLLLAVEIFPSRRVWPWTLAASLLVVCIATTWIFPYHYYCTPTNPHALVPLAQTGPLPESSLAYAVLAFRNLSYLAIVLVLGAVLYRRIDAIGEPARSAGVRTSSTMPQE